MTTGTGRTGRRPGPTRSRETVLAAARERFARQGFAATTLREIASDAGVDVALVSRLHGSKEELFIAAVPIPAVFFERMSDSLEGGPDGVGERVARAYLQLWDEPEVAAVLLATFRSIVSNDHAAQQMRDLLEARIVSALAPRLAVVDAPRRVAVAAAQLLGVAIARHVMQVPLLAELDREELVSLLAPGLQAALVPSSGRA